VTVGDSSNCAARDTAKDIICRKVAAIERLSARRRLSRLFRNHRNQRARARTFFSESSAILIIAFSKPGIDPESSNAVTFAKSFRLVGGSRIRVT